CRLGPLLGALLVMPAVAAGAAPGSGTLHWDTARNQVDAHIDGWSLDTLLEEIATATGWRVYVEPATRHTVATQFEKLGTVEALDRPLRGGSFALIPPENGPAKPIRFPNHPQP